MFPPLILCWRDPWSLGEDILRNTRERCLRRKAGSVGRGPCALGGELSLPAAIFLRVKPQAVLLGAAVGNLPFIRCEMRLREAKSSPKSQDILSGRRGFKAWWA